MPFSEEGGRSFKNYPTDLFRSKSDKEQFLRELHTINVGKSMRGSRLPNDDVPSAVVVNLAIFFAKIGAFYVSCSRYILTHPKV